MTPCVTRLQAAACENEAASRLLQLGDDLLQSILGLLSLSDLANLTCTCRRFHRQALRSHLSLTDDAARQSALLLEPEASLHSSRDTWKRILRFLQRRQFALSLQGRATVVGHNYAFVISNNGTLISCGPTDRSVLGIWPFIEAVTNPASGSYPPLSKVAAGLFHTLLVTEEGKLWGCGTNTHGEVGQGDMWFSYKMGVVKATEDLCITDLATAVTHTAMVSSDGGVYTCGGNTSGELGLGALGPLGIGQRVGVPTRVLGLGGIRISQVACGRMHTVMMEEGGGVWTCGKNDWGQLGQGDLLSRTLPTKVQGIPAEHRVVQVTAAGKHTLAVTSTGRLLAFGSNMAMHLAHTTDQVTLAADSSPMQSQPGYSSPVFVLPRYYHSCERALRHGRSLRVCHRVVQVATDDRKTAVLTENGELLVSHQRWRSQHTAFACKTHAVLYVGGACNGMVALQADGHLLLFGLNPLSYALDVIELPENARPEQLP